MAALTMLNEDKAYNRTSPVVPRHKVDRSRLRSSPADLLKDRPHARTGTLQPHSQKGADGPGLTTEAILT